MCVSRTSFQILYLLLAIGPLELASAGISISIFNIISKIFNVPLLSITTSFVAEDIAKNPTRQHGMDKIVGLQLILFISIRGL